MSYQVKELFYTLQGEGAQSGRPAVFCRFAGCNLWSGREADREQAICSFCDTDFVGTDGEGGGEFERPELLAGAARSLWPTTEGAELVGRPFVVCTGGEPLLQLDLPLVEAFHSAGFEVAVETNGTVPAPAGIDWLCLSPKANTDLVVRSGEELKLVYPQVGAPPAEYESLDFDTFFLQPMDGPEREENIRRTVAYCLRHPQWQLSLQTQKVLGIP